MGRQRCRGVEIGKDGIVIHGNFEQAILVVADQVTGADIALYHSNNGPGFTGKGKLKGIY